MLDIYRLERHLMEADQKNLLSINIYKNGL